jgi:arginine exporter protein ArgO
MTVHVCTTHVVTWLAPSIFFDTLLVAWHVRSHYAKGTEVFHRLAKPIAK